MIRPGADAVHEPMDKTYDSGQFESVMDHGAGAGRLARYSSARRGVEGARPPARARHRDVPRVDGRRRLRRARDGHRLRRRTSRSSRRRRRWAGRWRRRSRSSPSTCSACRSTRSRIAQGDTDRGTGFGSAGSRSLFVGGSAVRVASERTVKKAQELAAEELEAAVGDIEYRDGDVPHRRHRSRDRSLRTRGEAARAAHRARLDSSVADATWPNGCHICEVEIDPDTGAVDVAAYWSVNDVGRVVNPMIVVGPARRRRGAGHRPGAVRARRLRPRIRPAADRLVPGLRAAARAT